MGFLGAVRVRFTPFHSLVDPLPFLLGASAAAAFARGRTGCRRCVCACMWSASFTGCAKRFNGNGLNVLTLLAAATAAQVHHPDVSTEPDAAATFDRSAPASLAGADLGTQRQEREGGGRGRSYSRAWQWTGSTYGWRRRKPRLLLLLLLLLIFLRERDRLASALAARDSAGEHCLSSRSCWHSCHGKD